MSTDTPPPPYPHVLGWLTGAAPDTSAIAAELATMAQHGHFARLVTDLRLHGELADFRSALLAAFPQLDLAAPKFPAPQRPLGVLDNQGLAHVAKACLTAIALGGPEPAFDAKHFSSTPTGLLYDGVPVFATVDAERKRLFATAAGTLYVTSPDHSLKGWLQRQDADVTVQGIHGVAPDGTESGYNALEAAGTLVWACSYGRFDTPQALLETIAKSDAFGAIVWDANSFCTAGWVASMMPTLSTKGTIAIPGKTLTIGQNVHSTTVIGSAWIVGMMDMDCRQEQFPVTWAAQVKALLCPRASGHADLQNIVVFCTRLRKKYPTGATKDVPEPVLRERITHLVTTYPTDKPTLRALPGINRWYSALF